MAEDDEEDADDGAYDDDFEDEIEEDDPDDTMDNTRSSMAKSGSLSLKRSGSQRGSGRLSPEGAGQKPLEAVIPVVRRRQQPASGAPVATAAGGSAAGPAGLPAMKPALPPAVTRRQGSFHKQEAEPTVPSSGSSALPRPPDLLEHARGGSAGSAGNNRMVRGKISVTAEPRPDTTHSGDSGPSPTTHQAQASSKPSVPVWLQFNHDGPQRSRETGERCPAGRVRTPLGEDPYEGAFPQRGGSKGSARGVRPPLSSGDHFSARSRGGDISARGASPTPRREFDADAGGNGGSGGGDAERKVKRLQQEVQRLSQRLKEADLWSQDDMLPKFILEEVEVGCQIAQGGFSSVHHAIWRSTPCALKKIFDPVITEELKSEFENEVRMLRLLRHPHIVCLMAVCRVPPALSILTEHIAGGSIFELLHGGPSFSKRFAIKAEPPAVLPMIHQAAGAVAYMHAMSVVHRDIKTQNVLLTEGSRPIAKWCDFGLARLRSELCTGTMQWAGTACYMAPELFTKRKYNEMVDVFAFGTMIWEVASTEIPHANMDPPDIANRVQSKDGACLPVVHAWPKSLKTLLRTTLAVQPDGRPQMVKIFKDLEQVIMDFPPPD